MTITRFDDLLESARSQTESQRLLLVFAGASLPADATDAQRNEFDAGEGGELAPLMCVDKDPQVLDGFGTLVQEALSFGQPWVLMFAAALSGRNGQAPTSGQVDAALQRMVQAVKSGSFGAFIPFDRNGVAVRIG